MKAMWHGLLRSMVFGLAAVALCGAGVNAAQAAAPVVPGILSVTLGDHSLLRTPSTIGRVAVGAGPAVWP